MVNNLVKADIFEILIPYITKYSYCHNIQNSLYIEIVPPIGFIVDVDLAKSYLEDGSINFVRDKGIASTMSITGYVTDKTVIDYIASRIENK